MFLRLFCNIYLLDILTRRFQYSIFGTKIQLISFMVSVPKMVGEIEKMVEPGCSSKADFVGYATFMPATIKPLAIPGQVL
jgi:hypothetical protein